MPEFGRVAATQAYESAGAPEMVQLRLVDGASADTIEWPNLGYADAYAASFEAFDRLQQDGTIAADVRFQVQYPTPLASMAGTIVPEDMPAVAAAYESALFADLATLLERIPHDRVAVQWDVAVEFGLLEGAMGPGACRWSRSPRVWCAAWTGARRRAGGPAPLLRRLRPPALQAAGVGADAGRRRERRRGRRAAAGELGVVHGSSGP